MPPIMSRGGIVIVGAGVAGLTLAHRLLEGGIDRPVVVVERLDRVGGLARSFTYDGFTFDIGPHRFHSDDRAVMEYVLEILGDDYIEIGRSSALWLSGRFHAWPPQFNTMFRLPFSLMLKGTWDLLRRKRARNESFEDYVVERYGRTLYLVFFKPYAEKFLKHSCAQLHSDWARTGINRSVIDRRVKTETLLDLVRSSLRRKPVDTRFIYPKSGGNDMFCKYLERRIRALGGRLCLSSSLTGAAVRDGRVERVVLNGREEIETACLFWTAPIPALLQLLGIHDGLPRMEYLAIVLANYMVDAPPQQAFQWLYVGTDSSPVSRVSIPTLFNPALAPAGKSGLCVEVSCMEGDGAWEHPERMRPIVEEFLVKSKLVARRDSLIDARFERVPDAYPIYTLDYPRKLNLIVRELRRLGNVLNFGRTGGFWYNNQDHSIGVAMGIARAYLRAPDRFDPARFKYERDFTRAPGSS